jgi:hypothetical protein
MSDEIALRAPKGLDIGVNFPFTMVIEHAPLTLAEMFQVAKGFDLYEMEADLSDQEGLVKENILIDVLESAPTETVVKVTPVATLPYTLLARHTELMVKQVTKSHLKGKAKVVKIRWEIDKTGVASDLRSMLRKVG